MALLLCVIFFFSGAASVLFETLWFRAAGLGLGNSVWASNIVLASFMAGLAAGNALAARFGERVRRPLGLYAVCEVVVALTGVAIVLLLPASSPLLGRLFTHVLGQTWLVNLLRLTVAFTLLVLPATAMGVTLPLLAKAVARSDASFGRVLGRLYGWNTLGGMAGALGGELWLLGWLGQRGTALGAGALNLAAAAVALLLARRAGERSIAPAASPGGQRLGPRALRLLASAFVAGAALLALEVVWFRFLQLFVFGTSLIFAAMLATILLGIGAGGVLAGRWLGRDVQAHRFAPLVALAAGAAALVGYAAFAPGASYTTGNTLAALGLFLRLMLPTSLLSGVLFTLLGAALRQECRESAEATGKLTFANTMGAMVGALAAGFVVLPWLGMEAALFALALAYALVAGLALPAAGLRFGRRTVLTVLGASLALFALGGALYSLGLLRRQFIPQVVARYQSASPEILATREGLTETVMVLRTSFRGQPLYHRLMTNGHSMSATTYRGRRYMKLFAYWALARNPGARQALLVSYGIGSTAKALTDTRQLTAIDVVDSSRDILALAPLAFPGGGVPLADPRVRVHVEDGRFFLQTTDARYDLITAEPPPPRGAGIASLYSREYFQLVRDRLRDGGVVTHWLPVNLLWLAETQAILRGFCAVFPDCSLWSGAGLQWMLAGTRGARGPVSEAQWSAQWRDPVVAAELAELGLEVPESLAATFLADAATLGEWTRGVPPLDDDHPGRIQGRYPPEDIGEPTYLSWMEPRAVRRRFAASPFIRDLLPPGLRQRTVDHFPAQAVLDDLCIAARYNPIVVLHDVLTLTSLRTLPLLLMGSEPARQRIAVPLYQAGTRDAELEFEMGARALSERDYAKAEQHLALVTEPRRSVQARLLRTLALSLAGREAEGRACLSSIEPGEPTPVEVAAIGWLGRFLSGGLF
jgi:predicted membrane-bound spermidine synthase